MREANRRNQLFGQICGADARKEQAEETVAKPVGYLPTLDGWRAGAVLTVIFSHFAYSPTIAVKLPHWAFWALTGSGVKGVQLFFAISGFLITSRLIEEWNCFHQISLNSISPWESSP